MKITSVIAKPYVKNGENKTLWNVAIDKDGKTIGATAFDSEPHIGDEVFDDQLRDDGKGGFYLNTKKGKGGGKGYTPRNEDIETARHAMKLVVDLLIAGKINIQISGQVLAEQGIIIAKAIKATEAVLNGAGKPAEAKPVAQTASKPEPVKNGGIKSMGELRKVTKDTYPTLKTTALQDAIWGDSTKITNYDEAFALVVKDQEGK